MKENKKENYNLVFLIKDSEQNMVVEDIWVVRMDLEVKKVDEIKRKIVNVLVDVLYS